MIQIKGDESKIISFDFQVEGSNKKPQVRLVIEQVNTNFDLSIPAEINNGQVTARIPQLENLIEDFSGTKRLRARIEAIVEDSYFETWNDEIVVEQSVKVKAQQTDLKTEETKPKVNAKLTDVSTVENKIETIDEKKEYKITGEFIEASGKSTPGRMYPNMLFPEEKSVTEGCEVKPEKTSPKKKKQKDESISSKFESMLTSD